MCPLWINWTAGDKPYQWTRLATMQTDPLQANLPLLEGIPKWHLAESTLRRLQCALSSPMRTGIPRIRSERLGGCVHLDRPILEFLEPMFGNEGRSMYLDYVKVPPATQLECFSQGDEQFYLRPTKESYAKCSQKTAHLSEKEKT